MIKLIKSMPEYAKADFPAVRIFCNFAAYGEFDKIALFWAQESENGKTTALLSMIDGVLTISENGANTEEIKEFINALSPKTVLCDMNLATELNLKTEKVCTVMKAVPPYDTSGQAENTGEGISRLYEIMKNDFQLEKESFCADVSHRVRHNCAFFVTAPFGAAACLYCEKFAAIQGICVEKDKRLKGLGSALLSRIKSGVRDKVLFAATYGYEDFYIANNFTVCGKIAYCFGDTI